VINPNVHVKAMEDLHAAHVEIDDLRHKLQQAEVERNKLLTVLKRFRRRVMPDTPELCAEIDAAIERASKLKKPIKSASSTTGGGDE
jgi:chromosome segregation ATPase